MTRRIRCNAGFTLIEVMVVIIILGLLAAIVMPRLVGQTDKARYEQAKIQMRILEDALKRYKLENGRFPTTSQGLQALVQKPSTPPIPRHWPTGGYLDKPEIPLDPWGNEFIYVSPGHNGPDYDMVSLGADGLEGGEGYDQDVQSWSL
ncbi:type II secretion system major pseudopilin GspG [Candidatus Entotheonella palauensis]|uniref:Type II secretion system core protein G n=1 Tax=Candidatus Entotheonella gemina TaxID=1429439 RepID=W4M3V6_9BACT|nr:type II secretion system major pseudopilin GspG [Candidatus Entotheonella palauensis]ETX04297.1 MAG: general secretion pathway protein G [Candidatus Entotheonella gemina]